MRCLWLVGALLWSQAGLAQDCDRVSCGKGKRDVRGCCLPKPEPVKPKGQAKPRPKGGRPSARPDRAAEVGITWVELPGGSFEMGSVAGIGEADEQPRHWVTVRAFKLSKAEVTNAQYLACVSAGACSPPHWSDGSCWVLDANNKAVQGNLSSGFKGDDQPVVCVDWEQARGFASWVGGRLPTEAEWEYAARNGRELTYPWGYITPSCSLAVMADGSLGCGQSATWPVCSKPSGNSAQGVCDLAGNVWEWVEDEKCDYGQAPTDGSAASCASGDRVRRGGSWFSTAAFLRAALRGGDAPGRRGNFLGFRVSR